MTPHQVDAIQIILDNELAMSGLRQVFRDAAEESCPKVTDAAHNVLLGEQYRGYEQAKQIINDAFMKLQEYHRAPKEDDVPNPAV